MAVLKYKSVNGIKTLGIIKSGTSGVTSVNGKTGVITGLYDANNQPPYPVTSVDGKTGNINSVRIIYGGTYPLTIGQNTGIVVLVANISGGTLPVGNTDTYEILFDEAYPIPIAASFLGGGYGLHISVVRSNTNKSFYVNLTNHGFEGAISLTGSLVVAFIPNGATSVTGVSDA